MSRFLLVNFEDFSLKQDITKTIQPFNAFCICCLDRNGPMFDLRNCKHSDYLEAFVRPELKQFNQLVCLQCHSILKKIKYFKAQVIQSYSILLSGEFTNMTVNSKKQNHLIIQKVVDDLHLPPDIVPEDLITENIGNNQEDFSNVQNDSNMKQNFSHNMANVVQNDSNMEQNFTHNMANVVQNDSNIDQNFTDNMANVVQNDSNIDQNFTDNMANVVQNDSNMELYTNIEENVIQEQNRLNKNIKTALEILERNNQSFVSLGSQLQFLNGEHLSFLEPSLLSKEILSDIPLVPAKILSTDLENVLLNNSKSLEIDGTEKMFYDNLDLSPGLMGKETNISEIKEEIAVHTETQKEIQPKTKSTATKLKRERKAPDSLAQIIRRIKITHEELDRERVMQAQSEVYLRYKFRCETCIVGFNYKENLEDHINRKHGVREGDGVICDICSQLIPNAGSVTEHNYRHYTRYECVRCNKRYHTHDEAMQHYAKHQCFNSVKKNGAWKTKPTVQLKRAKLKMKPC